MDAQTALVDLRRGSGLTIPLFARPNLTFGVHLSPLGGAARGPADACNLQRSTRSSNDQTPPSRSIPALLNPAKIPCTPRHRSTLHSRRLPTNQKRPAKNLFAPLRLRVPLFCLGPVDTSKQTKPTIRSKGAPLALLQLIGRLPISHTLPDGRQAGTRAPSPPIDGRPPFRPFFHHFHFPSPTLASSPWKRASPPKLTHRAKYCQRGHSTHPGERPGDRLWVLRRRESRGPSQHRPHAGTNTVTEAKLLGLRWVTGLVRE
jgi:hypothetical protein